LRKSGTIQRSQSWVDGFAFQGKHPESAFVNTAKGLVLDEALKGFDPECEFAQGKRTFATQTTGSETR